MHLLKAVLGMCLALPVLAAVEESAWTLPNGASLTMVKLPAGTFEMGAPDDAVETMPDEHPRHQVVLSAPFWIGKTEVTQRQFESLMGYNPAQVQAVGDQQLPVEAVSWAMAVEFCKRLTTWAEQQGTLPPGFAFSLPTEAQWEYACAAGSTSTWSSGNSVESLQASAWTKVNAGGKSHPPGILEANPWGLEDMHGNVWEWCLDWKGAYPAGKTENPEGPDKGIFKVIRGGCYMLGSEHARTTNRSAAPPNIRWPNVGFRVVLAKLP